MLCRTLVLYALLSSAKAWRVLSTDTAALRVFERISLRKTFDPLKVVHVFRIPLNNELYDLLNEMTCILTFSSSASWAMLFAWIFDKGISENLA